MPGPGGIGKTTLLLEMRARATAAGRTTVLLDGSEIDPSPDGLGDITCTYVTRALAGPWCCCSTSSTSRPPAPGDNQLIPG
jgi:hypothetical protein